MPIMRRFLEIAVVIIISGCLNQSISDAAPHINLVYTEGSSSIYSISPLTLESEKRVIYKSKKNASILNITKVSSASLIFDECYLGECTLNTLDINTGNHSILRKGIYPTYLENRKELLFYDSNNTTGSCLHLANIKNINSSVCIANDPGWLTWPNGIRHNIKTQAVQISNDLIIFIGDKKELYTYSVSKKKSTPTNIKNCSPITWLSNYSKLLCSDFSFKEKFTIDLNSRIIEEIPEISKGYGFIYNKKKDILVYSRIDTTKLIIETPNIYTYSFNTKKNKLSHEYSNISGGALFELTPIN